MSGSDHVLLLLLLHCSSVCILPKTTPQGYTVIFARFRTNDPTHFVFEDAAKYEMMAYDTYLLDNPFSPGLVRVIDMGGMTFGHLAKTDISMVRKYLVCLQVS